MSDDTIIEKWGLPRDIVSCPACGQLYGHHKTKVCKMCEECGPCCKKRGQCAPHYKDSKTEIAAQPPQFVAADTFVRSHS